MKRIIVVALLLVGCGGSGLPGGDQTITVNQNQDQDNNQVQNESEVECSRSCSVETDGGSNLSETCKGGASSVLAAFATFDECRAALLEGGEDSNSELNVS